MAAPKFHSPQKLPRTASYILRSIFAAMQSDRVDIQSASEMIPITRTGLNYWKSGRCDPSITKVEALAQTLGYRLELVKND